jgi:phosphate/sulfate permease
MDGPKSESNKANMSPLKTNLLRIMRIFLLIAGIYVLLFGGANGAERIFGLLILIALAIIHTPTVFTRGRIRAIPIEIEFLLLSMVIFELVGGDALGLYVRLPHYDNFMHFMLPLYIALIGMMLVYTMYFYGRLKATIPVMALLIILVTIGLGGVLEMGEYTYDKYLSHTVIGEITGNTQMQGSPTQDALDDTMNDLFTDTAGAIVGAAIGVLLIRRAEKRGSHWGVADEIEEMIN